MSSASKHVYKLREEGNNFWSKYLTRGSSRKKPRPVGRRPSVRCSGNPRVIGASCYYTPPHQADEFSLTPTILEKYLPRKQPGRGTGWNLDAQRPDGFEFFIVLPARRHPIQQNAPRSTRSRSLPMQNARTTVHRQRQTLSVIKLRSMNCLPIIVSLTK